MGTPPTDDRNAPAILRMPSQPIFVRPDGGGSWVEAIRKAVLAPGGQSNQAQSEGIQEHPFDMEAIQAFRSSSSDHSACLDLKRVSSVGLGLESEAAEAKLDPLCEISFQETINPVADDHCSVGNGYIEVIRDDGGRIVGLHHAPAHEVHVVLERERSDRHFEMRGGRLGSGSNKFARFGDLEDMRARLGISSDTPVSELIHIPRMTSLSRHYGWPEWLAAVAAIEVVMEVLQHNHDFFRNHAVPDLLLLFLKQKLAPQDWQTVKETLQSQLGPGRAHKTAAINLEGSELVVQVERLGQEMSEGFLIGLMDSMARLIVTAHRVPPALGGILVPGKLGATNELTQAVKVFDRLVTQPIQKTITTVLGCTLGNPDLNGGLGLDKKAFAFKRVLDELDLDPKVTGLDPMNPRQPGADRVEDVKKALDPEQEAALIYALFQRFSRRVG